MVTVNQKSIIDIYIKEKKESKHNTEEKGTKEERGKKDLQNN